MDLLDRLEDVRRRPSLYGLTSFGEVVAFINGIDAATEWRFLVGFREWLANKWSLGENLSWQTMILRITYPQKANALVIAALHDVSSEAVAVLFGELGRFLESQSRSLKITL